MEKYLYKPAIAVFLVSMVTLIVELTLARLFDVLLNTNISYLVLTCVVFSLGLSGVYVAIKPMSDVSAIAARLRVFLFLYAVSLLISIWVINTLPFDLERVGEEPVRQILCFGGLFLVLIVPFVFAGMVFSYLFSAYARHIQLLYCFDLVGAAIGSIAIIPLLPHLGPGGILILSGALMLLCTTLFLRSKRNQLLGCLLAAIVGVSGIVGGDDWFAFRYHYDKRDVLTDIAAGKLEFSTWDPISKIDVIARDSHIKHIAYDGGSQSSHFFQFDGDYSALRDRVLQEGETGKNFWGVMELGSHYLLRDTGQEVLVIGAAGGKETKAALMYGASRVDAVELVGTVIDLGKNQYADFIGQVYNNPKVNAITGEGRSYLRGSDKKYDIIQIFSNHTSSSIASGTGALSTTYLQTVEAYKEYFTHLTQGGILHINHHIYPRMVVTAAQAWKELDRSDFGRHVLVYSFSDTTLPTMLIKNLPWTEAEVGTMDDLYLNTYEGVHRRYKKVENPLQPGKGFLAAEFYEGDLPKAMQEAIPYHVGITTDDRPYFNQLRKSISILTVDPEKYVNESIAGILNSQLRKGIVPMDLIHLMILPLYAVVIIILVIWLPMRFSQVGREAWPHKFSTLLYFSCLGFGFILIEVVLIQIFMKLVGSPLYTYSVVLFGMLFGAGVGSFSSDRLGISPSRRWYVPFIGIFISILVFLLAKDVIFEMFLSDTLVVRVFIALMMILPMGFFMGMPFPVGILSIKNLPKGAVAWAWAINGIFTVVGGYSAIIISLFAGFTYALLVGGLAYVVAFFSSRVFVQCYDSSAMLSPNDIGLKVDP